MPRPKATKKRLVKPAVKTDFEDVQKPSVKKEPSNLPSSPRKRTLSTVEHEDCNIDLDEARKKQEKEWDLQLPEQYRKYRPRGYPLYLPKDTTKNLRVYCDGIYDLFHVGHMNQLKQCKMTFPNVTLVVGVPADSVTWKNKGLTVLTDEQRCAALSHCKWVDEVIPNAPWAVTPEFMTEHKLDFVAHDDIPYASAESDDVYAPVKRLGKFIVTQRTEGISTLDIITKIIRDYDKYLMRNFARGALRQELNVSWLKKNELDIKKHIDEFRAYWKKTNQSLNNASRDLYYEVREHLRGRKPEEKERPDSTGSSRASSVEPILPATEFAMRFSGNRNRSFIRSFKRWVFKEGDVPDYFDHDNSKESSFESRGTSPDVEEPVRKKKRSE